jgi:carbonic anhydrase
MNPMNPMHGKAALVCAMASFGLACAFAAPAAEPKGKAATESAWQVIFTEAGRRMEVDRASVKKEANGKTLAWGRVIFEKPVPDAVSGSGYRVLEALNRYDCNTRSFATVKRVYRKDEETLLREEDSKTQSELPVRTGTLDDKVLRIACKPTGAQLAADFNDTVSKAKTAVEAPPVGMAGAKGAPVRPAGSAVRKRPKVIAAAAPVPLPETKPVPWSYEGEGSPEHWATLRPEYKVCATGERQSPIDIRDGIKVDLPPILFQYKPAQFRIVDTGTTVQVAVSDNRISLMGKDYELIQFRFHKPSEERVAGKSFDMVAHFVHRSDDNRLAIVAVHLEKGAEHPVVQTLWNYLPLERNVDVYPPDVAIDLNQLLPEKKGYYTYMGSLTEPPCTEGVLWLVMKDPVQVSAEQIAIFGRLYRSNARPVQPLNGRLIKESR